MKLNVVRYPDFTLSLHGLVRALARLGRLPEAEAYLVRAKSTDPVWGSFSETVLQVMRGDIRKESIELEHVLANPDASNAMRGIICFMLGDVERGVRFWHEIEPTFLRLLWQFNSSEEGYFAAGVVEDPRYQALLDELGIGRKWRAYMRASAAELTPVTGIAVTSQLPPEDRDAY
jgi:hypothetical protein